MPIKKTNKTDQARKDIPAKKKSCYYCGNSKQPSFLDSVNLRRYMSDRSRINSKQRSGNCSYHQRILTEQIKYARHLALLPFITKVV